MLRIDRSREGGRIAVRVLLHPGVDPRELLISRVDETVLLSHPRGDRRCAGSPSAPRSTQRGSPSSSAPARSC
ncbi:hypothetical protein ACFQXA_38245 [Nocardiopsis composta]